MIREISLRIVKFAVVNGMAGELRNTGVCLFFCFSFSKPGPLEGGCLIMQIVSNNREKCLDSKSSFSGGNQV